MLCPVCWSPLFGYFAAMFMDQLAGHYRKWRGCTVCGLSYDFHVFEILLLPTKAWHHERTSDAPFTYRPQAYSFPEDVVREQIQLELQTLRAQITKSQAVLTYLVSLFII
ncbi:hypothetical protein HPB51_002110 [Rhipicephalus microplus]|uniref:Uncharacterized protein n=1 Tax=Rhipicephalus microplus TaxID=6941 RepID=A0A9J6E6G0_RHIMP|nr:hypothetical protein HPB51_002110 [Rhipicephalus microplus]